MPETPRTETTLRDDLALERTILANERTMLAYIRTAVALVLTGASALHLPGLYPGPTVNDMLYYIGGGVLAGLGFLVGIFGYVRYRRVKAGIDASPSDGVSNGGS